ncbi:histidine ammonia-lyase [Euzebya pacifica]|uniref:histidine ammonia-lyase n=1 Tax=Euzebya pacifica TaxID=1608957 RepID=UPI0030FA1E7C
MEASVVVGRNGVAPQDVIDVARRGARVVLGDDAREALERGADVVAGLLDKPEPVYGVSTGFGALADTVIPVERSAELQLALVRSHAAGMGPELEQEVIRAMMMLRARSLAMGYSGARPHVAERICEVLNAGIVPVVREHGSVGASGDLAPLAAAALTLTGEGIVDTPSGRKPAAEALADAGLEPLHLTAKEGLALINGTDGMLGMLVMALQDLRDLYLIADVAAAMTVEALLGTDQAYAADLVAMRPQPGQQASAANLRNLLAGSPTVASHRHGDTRVQDAYSLRCTPQVHGAGRDVIGFAATVADNELQSFIDNPVVLFRRDTTTQAGGRADGAEGDDGSGLVLPDGRVASCGNFHGAPVAYAADLLRIPVADLSALSERRTDRLLDPARSHGLPPFLTTDAGVNSGLMIAQYTQAAMVTTNRRLAAPASVDTLSTSAGQEDHVSMGWGACRALREVVANLRRILAVEVLAATHAQVLRGQGLPPSGEPLRPGAATGAVAEVVLEAAGGPGPDEHLEPRLAAVERLLETGAVLTAARAHADLT